jgi:hypothetical protein
MFGLTGCNRKTIIPDETLASIFHDAFVVNAYVGEERINIDSLYIYEPIFRKYGYTTKDVIYTIGNFSRRKSVRLGSVVEQAIAQLEQEHKVYDKKVVILDSIRGVALRSFKRDIYYDSLIVAKKRADSTLLRIEITPAPRGEYVINYNYTCEDDLDKYHRSAEFYFTDENGYKKNRTTVTLRKTSLVNRTLIAREDHSSLVLELGKYTNLDKDSKGKKKRKKSLPPKEQNLEIKNLKIQHKLNEEDSIDSLFARYVDVKIFADDFLIKRDSVAVVADTTAVSTPIEPIDDVKSIDDESLVKKDSLALSADTTRVSAPTTNHD